MFFMMYSSLVYNFCILHVYILKCLKGFSVNFQFYILVASFSCMSNHIIYFLVSKFCRISGPTLQLHFNIS